MYSAMNRILVPNYMIFILPAIQVKRSIVITRMVLLANGILNIKNKKKIIKSIKNLAV